MVYKRKASVSQIQRFLKCPRSWYYRYKERVPEPKSIHLIRGSLVHLAIENFFEFGPRTGKFNKKNYKTRIPELMFEVFEKAYNEPGNYFGKATPSPKEDLYELFDGDDELVEAAYLETKLQLTNYINKYLINLEMFFLKTDDFSKAYKNSKPSFREYEIVMDDFTGYIDQIFEVGDLTILSDLKTSTLKVGKVPDSDFYTPLGVTGLERDYMLQMYMYLWSYYELTGTKADFLVLNYLKYGNEVCIPTEHLDIDMISEQMSSLVAAFMDYTESDNIADYPMNIDGEVSVLPMYKMENLFCSANSARFAGRGFCPYDHLCNKELGEVPDAPEEVIVKISGSFQVITIPGWLAAKKGMYESEIIATIELDDPSKKAILIKYNGDESAWIPRSVMD